VGFHTDVYDYEALRKLTFLWPTKFSPKPSHTNPYHWIWPKTEKPRHFTPGLMVGALMA